MDGLGLGTIFRTGTTQLRPDDQSSQKILPRSRPGSCDSVAPAAQPSICDLMRQDINETPQGTAQSSYVDLVVDIPVVESLSPFIISSTTPPPVVDAPVRSLTPNNWSLSFMQSGSADRPQLHVPLSRGAVSSVSLRSTDLLYYVEPLPLDQML